MLVLIIKVLIKVVKALMINGYPVIKPNDLIKQTRMDSDS